MSSRNPVVTRDSVRSELRDGFADKVIRAMTAAYAEAKLECAENYGPEGGDLYGHLLRAKVERNLHQSFSGVVGVTVRFDLNASRNSRHLVIEIGRLVITESMVDTPWTMVRRAEFRETLAQSAQGDLFASSDDGPIRSKLYLLIVHGPGGASAPAFIDIVPPTANCGEYVEHARINLIAESAAVAAPATVTAEKVTPATAELLAGASMEEEKA